MPEYGIAHRGVGLGVLVGVVDVLIWRHFVPTVTDIRTAQQFNGDVESAERTALITSTAFTVLVALFARSMEVFAIGGVAILGLDFSVKHANAVNPDTGKMAQQVPATSNLSDAFPMPDYANAE